MVKKLLVPSPAVPYESFARLIDDSLLAKHVGGRGVFSTPSMIMLMELASHAAVEALVPQGYTTVGYEVSVRHLAPAEPGSTVHVKSTLKEVDGKKLLFEVSCHETDRLIALGSDPDQFVVRSDA
jgi:predicted thioesterase